MTRTLGDCDSTRFHESDVEPDENVRAHYLSRIQQEAIDSRDLVLVESSFLPAGLAQRLMSDKRDSAIGAKFVKGSRITNMEGALHTFVTALARIKMHGDYEFRSGHGVRPFPLRNGKQQYREVILSTAIHLDFETDQVAWQLYRLQDSPVEGQDAVTRPLTPEDYDNDDIRLAYDEELRRLAIYHLTERRRVPSKSEAVSLTVSEAISALEADLTNRQTGFLFNKAVVVHGHYLSLEMMQRSYCMLLHNDMFSASRACTNGCVYTYDPPSIFARYLDATLLNRIMLHGLRDANFNFGSTLRAFAFNDYADIDALRYLRLALAGMHQSDCPQRNRIQCIAKRHLDMADFPGCALLIHNNSDAFGQNIETEGISSLDGAIGNFSNAATILRRDRFKESRHTYQIARDFWSPLSETSTGR